MPPKLRKKVHTALKLLLQEMKKRNDNMPTMEFPGQEFWNTRLANNPEYGLVLEASQRMCYGALYFGYEHFLVGNYEVVTGEKDYEIYEKTFAKHLTATFGQSICDTCWTPDHGIKVARSVRHALVHSGGRDTPYLQAMNHGLRIENGKLCILPADTKALFGRLKDRVLRVTSKALDLLPKTS
jgi:hypothetical protein